MSKIDLFKILGTIAVDNAAANKALSETSSKAKGTANDISGAAESGDSAGGKWANGLKKVGSAAVTVGKTVATGLAVAGGAVAGLVTASVNAYADYEQLVGGVETLFKESAGKVQEYAKNAYKTAGLSANEYMETVTSFSASLIQSLDGDTKKAAEQAQMAITDMSDNANKMGTDIGMIQNAYNGFAKQNYTMLDNLKLGYGGTKEEMARLIADANKVKEANGEMADLSMESFSDVVEAIHIIQSEMGITGTTAKEASSTISGSIASMKGSWQNLLTAISADDLPFEDYVKSFADSVSTVAGNLLPRIQTALNGVVMLINQLAPVIVNALPGLVSTLIPALINAATGLINALVAAMPQLLTALMDCVPALLSAITTIFGVLVGAVPDFITMIVNALPGLIPQLVNGLVAMIMSVATMLPQIIMPIINALPGVILSLADALLTNLPILIQGLCTLITAIVTMIPTILPVLVDVVMQLISMLTTQLPVILPVLINALVSIITLITEQLPVIMPMLIQACITIVGALIDAFPTIIMALVDALPALLAAVWDAIVMVFTELPNWFGQIWQGVKDKFSQAVEMICGLFGTTWENVWTNVKTFFSNIWNSVSSFFKTVWDGICNVVSIGVQLIGSILDAAFQIITLPFRFIWENCKEYIIAAWDAIKSAVSKAINAVKDTVSKVFTAIKDFIVPLWDKIKTSISNVWTSIKTAISNAVNSIKTTVSNVFNSVKTTVGNIFNSIKEKMQKPIESARDTIKGIVDKIKGFFSGMKISFPSIKLPHFSIKPSGWKIGDLLQGEIPKLGIDWYAKAMRNPLLMDSPTIFGYDAETGRLKGGGEAGSEVVAGTNTLMGMIGAAVESKTGAMTAQIVAVLTAILEAIVSGNSEMLAALLEGHVIEISGREFGRTVRKHA